MSAPSITASQTNFCDAMSHVNISSEPNSGYDTPVPRARISYTKKSFQFKDLHKNVTCKLSNVSYLISCKKCQKPYVSEISRAFRKRMYGHKSSVQIDGLITPVSRHFKSEGHNHRYMVFSVLEWCTPKFEHTCTSRHRSLSWHGYSNTLSSPYWHQPICLSHVGMIRLPGTQ